jgi:hypothetical protein
MGVAIRLQMGRAGVRGLDDLRHYVEHRRPSARKQRQLDRATVASVRSGRVA